MTGSAHGADHFAAECAGAAGDEYVQPILPGGLKTAGYVCRLGGLKAAGYVCRPGGLKTARYIPSDAGQGRSVGGAAPTPGKARGPSPPSCVSRSATES